MVPVVFDRSYDRYFFGPTHPFSPIRQHMVLDLLEALGESPRIVTPRAAAPDEITSVHSHAYVEQVRAAGSGNARADAAAYGLGTPDVPLFEDMDEAARILVGGTVKAAEMIESGVADKVLQLGGGLHHAHRSMASGFCVYNDLSCAIRFFRENGWRVAYLDIDVHHGDGVDAIHAHEREVLTISLHESGHYLYPGSGFSHDIGKDDGRGFSLNVPLEPGTSDTSYLEVFDRVVPHTLAWFQPDVLIVQCGVDAHFRDPLADLLLTSRGFERLFRRIIEVADKHAGGRALFTLGGGYDLDASSRLWTMLYLMLQEVPLPETLPQEYMARWRERVRGADLTPTLHDPPVLFAVDDSVAVENQNRLVSRRVLELAAPHWY